jgi:hypothetical protein
MSVDLTTSNNTLKINAETTVWNRMAWVDKTSHRVLNRFYTAPFYDIWVSIQIKSKDYPQLKFMNYKFYFMDQFVELKLTGNSVTVIDTIMIPIPKQGRYKLWLDDGRFEVLKWAEYRRIA